MGGVGWDRRGKLAAGRYFGLGLDRVMGAKRLLVIDDSAAFAEYVRNVAETLGFGVELSHDGKVAKTAYHAFKPDVIILDMVMPEVDGIEIVHWLADEGCEARLIVVTGYSPHYAEMTKTLAEARGFELVKTLNKPLRLAELRAALVGDPEGDNNG
jgi:CheY-like chemotaxis protein